MSRRESGTYIELDEAWNDPGWTRVPNTVARCATISRRLKGWILECASHEPGRRLTLAAMLDTSTDGRDATYSTIKEGVASGFVTRHQERDDSGRMGVVVYRIHVEPQNRRSEPSPAGGAQQNRRSAPLPAFPDTAEPDTAKPETSKKTRSSLEDQKERRSKDMATAAAVTAHNDQPGLFEDDQPLLSEAGVPVSTNGHKRQKIAWTTAPPERYDLDQLWEAFWRVYPKKVKKLAARKCWDKAVAVADPRDLIAAAETYARQQADPWLAQFTKHPTTWLNGGCWDDEPERAPGGNGRGRVSATELPADDWRRWVQE